jgi:hypothetical protein
MIAKFTSKCPLCHQWMRAGIDQIEKSNGKWVHDKCPTIEPVIEDTATVEGILNEVANGQGFEYDPESVEDIIETVPTTIFTPSKYQQAVFDFVQHGSGHGVIEAVAGSGKTTTIVKALEYTPVGDSVAFVAFNKHIADELKKVAPSHVAVSTLHSLGYSNLREQLGHVRVDQDKLDNILAELSDRYEDLYIGRDIPQRQRAEAYQLRSLLKKVVALAKATLWAVDDACDVEESIQQLCDRYGIDLNGSSAIIAILLPIVLKRCKADSKTVDYDDMIWLPVELALPLKKFDWVFVDETQDLNASQLEFVLRSVKPTGRIIAVGDRWQSLYGFRGADTEAIPRMISKLNATILPLSISYRCPTSHIEQAKFLVEAIEAREGAEPGIFSVIKYDYAVSILTAGDMIICRTNAPLIPIAFHLVRLGIKAMVRGRDIGQGLVTLVRRFKADSIRDFVVMLEEYKEKEIERLGRRKNSEMAIESVQDKCETLQAIAASCDSMEEVEHKIESIFSDDNASVTLSKIGRAHV